MTDLDFTPWRRLADPEAVAAAIIDVYRRRGGDRYDEVVTQSEHGLQAASRAMAAGATDEVVVAAFVHDIGHLLLADAERSAAFRHVDLHHEDVGGRFLANWFGPEVTAPVELHVAAKRYLCATDVAYLDALSPASVTSLRLQGGPMTDDEIEAFATRDGFAVAVDVRRWDDQAKVAAAPTPPLEVVGALMVDVLSRRAE